MFLYSVLQAYQKESCLIFSGCRNGFQNKPVAADLGG